jgi:hypothetical protein
MPQPLHISLILCATVLLCGCTPKAPVTSHGKPVSHWLEEVKTGDAKGRRKAVVALGHVGTHDPAIIPALIEAAKDEDAGVRAEVVLALLNIGPAAKEAIPALKQETTDSDATVRSYAVKALEKIDPGGSAGP